MQYIWDPNIMGTFPVEEAPYMVVLQGETIAVIGVRG